MSGTPGTETGLLVMELWKMVANFRRAASWSPPMEINEFVGCGLVSAMMRLFAASCADMLGILQWVGKNSTVSQIHVPCVFRM